MRMRLRLHRVFSSRIFIIYMIITLFAAILAVTLIPELTNTTRSFYDYNDTTYEPKDMERYIYELRKEIASIENEYPMKEINDYGSEESYRRLYRLKQSLKEVETLQDMSRSQKRLKKIEESYKFKSDR